VLLQETWLDASTEEIRTEIYKVVSRRDRSTDTNRGGVLTLARSDFNHLVHICNSDKDERSWHYLNIEPGNILVGNWYRPGATDHDGYESLESELSRFASEYTGVILTGDLNIHHARWLRFSNGNTAQGADLKVLCDNHGLSQLTREPTRQQYLLDLFLSDVPGCKVTVGAYIADHKFLQVSVPVPETNSKIITRYGFQMARAKWSQLENALNSVEWTQLQRGTAEDALNFFMETLWVLLCTFIPYKKINFEKKTHPWINERCSEAIRKKNDAENTPAFEAKRQLCAQVLAEEYQRHIAKLKEKISNLTKGSKQWWRLNRELLDKKSKISSIPPLRDGAAWVNDSKSKANLLAQTFDNKAKLPPEEVDCPFFGLPDSEFEDFVALRSRKMQKMLESLDISKATGPDRIPASILRRLAKPLAIPFARVCRRLYAEACWPEVWKLHHICPLYKRGSAFLAGNYRGVHLTNILAKTAERFIGAPLMAFLHNGLKFGRNQWAFTPGLSARDLVTALVMSWILGICSGKKIAGYLGDITGAFDRVFKDYLLAKLQAAGVGANYLNFLNAYLQPRRARVIVEGESSDDFEIANTVFQGTVLGPCLWNVFFSDVQTPASSTGGQENLFADDLSVFKQFDRNSSNDDILRDMHVTRARVHKWGRTNRVSFDPAKEHLVILHPIDGTNETFKFLGCVFDPKLVMNQAVDKILSHIRPKVKAILRTRQYYDATELISQFKTHVWGNMETHNGGLFHAASYLLAKFDSLQHHFLNEIGVTESNAFIEHNFAPPTLRRNIGVLGLIHKRVLGNAHPVYQSLLPFFTDVFGYPRQGHNKQLYGHILEAQFQLQLFKRSIFGMVDVYNALSQEMVDLKSVKIFQSELTKFARARCVADDANWISSFAGR